MNRLQISTSLLVASCLAVFSPAVFEKAGTCENALDANLPGNVQKTIATGISSLLGPAPAHAASDGSSVDLSTTADGSPAVLNPSTSSSSDRREELEALEARINRKLEKVKQKMETRFNRKLEKMKQKVRHLSRLVKKADSGGISRLEQKGESLQVDTSDKSVKFVEPAPPSGVSSLQSPAKLATLALADTHHVDHHEASNRDSPRTSIPADSSLYVVQSGDTPSSIAAQFNITVKELRSWNDLNDVALQEGQLLRVQPPSGQEADTTDSKPSTVTADAKPSSKVPSDTTGPSSTADQDQKAASENQASRSPNVSPKVKTVQSDGSSLPRGPSDPTMTPDRPETIRPYPGSIPRRFDRTSPAFTQVRRAAATYRRSGVARVVQINDEEEVYPYGKEVPTVYTPVLHFSTVLLAKNEYVTNMSIGDRKRWSVSTGSMGTKSNFQQMVYIKPQKCGPMQTNLLLATNQGRTYELILKSIPCNMAKGKRPDMSRWDRRISYYYPDGRSIGPSNMQKDLKPPQFQGRSRPQGRSQFQGRFPSPSRPSSMKRPGSSTARPPLRPGTDSAMTSPMPPGRRMSTGSRPFRAGRSSARGRRKSPRPASHRSNPAQSGRTSRFISDRGSAAKIDLRNLNTGYYEIDLDRGFPCKPALVGDDGERTYIRLSDSPGCQSTFPLFQLRNRGKLKNTNYSIFNGQTYVVPGVHDDLALVYRNSQGKEKRAVIKNTKISNPRR